MRESILHAIESGLTDARRAALVDELAGDLSSRQLIKLGDELALRYADKPELAALVHVLIGEALVRRNP